MTLRLIYPLILILSVLPMKEGHAEKLIKGISNKNIVYKSMIAEFQCGSHKGMEFWIDINETHGNHPNAFVNIKNYKNKNNNTLSGYTL